MNVSFDTGQTFFQKKRNTKTQETLSMWGLAKSVRLKDTLKMHDFLLY